MGSPQLESNLAQGYEVVGRFTLSTAGAVGTLRPSAGSAPSAGAGSGYTVTQLATAFGGASGDNCYRVVIPEQYKVVGAVATYSPAYSLTTADTVPLYHAQASTYDAATNSFVITVYTVGTPSGAAAAPVRTNALATGSIVFRVSVITTVSPATT